MTKHDERLRGSVVLVTGAAQGIGAVYARGLAAQGAAVAVCDVLDPQPVVAAIHTAGGPAIGAIVDVTDEAALAAFVAGVERELGPIDGLVNNAALFGSLVPKSFLEISAEEWAHVMNVNTGGVLACTKAVVPGMRNRKRGKIVNIASTTFHTGTPMLMHYVASKGAVVAMTRVMARELGDFGITVNAISPGLTSSEGVKRHASFAKSIEGSIARRSFKREQLPEDLLGPLTFLLSEESAFVTGQTVVVDGGAFML